MSRLATAADAPIIAGNIGITNNQSAERGYDLHNSADFIQLRWNLCRPLRQDAPRPVRRIHALQATLLLRRKPAAGRRTYSSPASPSTVFTTGGHTYGTFICYESIFGDEIRQFANLGADVLVNISDDGWYGDTSAAWEHLNMVRMRAIENHRWVLRATNTGVTAAIDPYGRVVRAAPRHIRTSLRVGFNYEHDVTFYAAHGDLFAWFCALIIRSRLCSCWSWHRHQQSPVTVGRYCGGGWFRGCGCLSPPPKIFWKKFFFGAGGPLVSGGCVGCRRAGSHSVLGSLHSRSSPCISVCGDAPIWLHVLPGTVPSRNAMLVVLRAAIVRRQPA